jgi:hypothetical protein
VTANVARGSAPAFVLPLELDRDRGFGHPIVAPERIEDAVILGKPTVRPVTRERFGDDVDLRLFLPDADERPEFYLVTFSCTFVLPKPLRFKEAGIRVVLAGGGDDDPVARRVLYEVATQSSTISDSMKGGAGPFTVKRSETVTRGDLVITPRNEGTSCPEWHLSQQAGLPIEQPPRFTLIVDAPSARPIHGTAVISAELAGPNPLRNYRVPLAETRQLNWLVIDVPSH